MLLPSQPLLPLVVGVAGEVLTHHERALFAHAAPAGLILFGRNCREPRQVMGLIDAARSAAGWPELPVLIDQEGGRVARLGPPAWPASPAPRILLPAHGPVAAADLKRARAFGRLQARTVAALGIAINCLPLLDVPAADSDPIMGDRTFGADPAQVTALARAVMAGHNDVGVLPVIKHLPGHGRARVDSHQALPVVDASAAALAAHDWLPLMALAPEAPLAMTAHVVYPALDAAVPATWSRPIIQQVIRERFGFCGILLSDDICMGALAGPAVTRAQRALTAGCDLAVHCDGDATALAALWGAIVPMSQVGADRWARLVRGQPVAGALAAPTAEDWRAWQAGETADE